MNQTSFIRPFGEGESFILHQNETGSINASHPPFSLSMYLSVRVLQKCYCNTKREGVKVLHRIYYYYLSGLSELKYNLKCV